MATQLVKVTVHAVGEKTEVTLELTAQEAEGVRKLVEATLSNKEGDLNPFVVARWENGKLLSGGY